NSACSVDTLDTPQPIEAPFWRGIYMSRGPFSPSQFIPTRWSTAEEKARFGNALLHLINSGFARNLFTDRLYGRVSNCFGHIAHYNSTGFYEEWFLSLTAQVRFLEHTLRFPCYGDPEFTFSDVESEIQREESQRVFEKSNLSGQR